MKLKNIRSGRVLLEQSPVFSSPREGSLADEEWASVIIISGTKMRELSRSNQQETPNGQW
jgi:hypothetical protein